MIVKEVVEGILQKCQIPPISQTCDQLIVGNWEQEVTGIVTTFMATVEVIRESVDRGANLIITHEPTFFNGLDQVHWLAEDLVYAKKTNLIRNHGINIWRFHDHMHRTQPDLIYDGLIKELDWESHQDPEDKHCFIIPQIPLMDLVKFLKEKLQVEFCRAVGNMNGQVERVGILVGGGSLGLGREEMPMELIRQKNLDTVICGEILEWTLPAYVRDAAQLGMNKSLIILGHNRTEEIGMKHLVVWLKPLFPDLPVEFIESGDPFVYF